MDARRLLRLAAAAGAALIALIGVATLGVALPRGMAVAQSSATRDGATAKASASGTALISASAPAPAPAPISASGPASASKSASSPRPASVPPPASASASAAPASSAADANEANEAALIQQGAYLAKAGDCAGCHTAPPGGPSGREPLRARPPFAGGLPMGSPFGTIYSSNITPDPNAGIGRYSYADFVRAVREGVAPGGKRLYPAMPYPSFAKISDADMRALYAYFMHGVAPVAERAPPTRLPFPFSQRWGMALWDLAFGAPDRRFAANPQRDAQWNRGAYLVQSLGHCGACHTPRGPAYQELGYDDSARAYLTGGVNDHWFAPNLTADPGSGLGRIGAADLVAFLKQGHGAGLVTFGSMVQVVEDSTQYLNDDDLNAITHYLKSLPAQRSSGAYVERSAAAAQTLRALQTGVLERPGAGLYQSFCARCHQADGSGVAQKYPRLAGNPAVLAAHDDSLIRLLLEGGAAPHTLTGPMPRKMPAFANQLTDVEIARVLSFVRSSWGNAADPVTTREVSRLRAQLQK